MDYERVIGLEVHCELKTNSKMFSASPVTFGEDPNTMINEVDMGMTGTLPCLNKRGVEFAIRVCHALHMEIDEFEVAKYKFDQVIDDYVNVFYDQALWYKGLCLLKQNKEEDARLVFAKIAKSESYYNEQAKEIVSKLK